MSKADMTRDRIRRAAAELFSQRAYKEVTVRQIAAAANVDATLINHYFGGKEALFNTIIATAVEAKVQSFDFGSIPLENLGAEFIRYADELWSSPDQHVLQLLIRQGLTSAPELIGKVARQSLIEPVVAQLPFPKEEGILRFSLAGSQILGVLAARYIVRIPTLVAMDTEELVRFVAPSIQRYLTGDLGL